MKRGKHPVTEREKLAQYMRWIAREAERTSPKVVKGSKEHRDLERGKDV